MSDVRRQIQNNTLRFFSMRVRFGMSCGSTSSQKKLEVSQNPNSFEWYGVSSRQAGTEAYYQVMFGFPTVRSMNC